MAKSKNLRQKKLPKELSPKSYLYFLVSCALILAGSAVLLYNAISQLPPTVTIKAAEPQAGASDQEIHKPTKIYIPKMKRILAVSDGYYIDKRWTVAETGVSFYTDSAIPGHGNSVLYGHNRKGILGGLWRVDSGDYIYLILANGHFVKYQVSEEKEIKPTQVEILAKTSDSRLTLYTCSGFLDTARFVVVGNQVESTI